MLRKLRVGIAGRYALEIAVIPTLGKITTADSKLIRTLRYDLNLRTIQKQVQSCEAKNANRDDGLRGFDALNAAEETVQEYTCEDAPLDKLREWLTSFDGAKVNGVGQALGGLMETIADLSDAVDTALASKPVTKDEKEKLEAIDKELRGAK